jgi:prepilin-type N-terminal cleavage/methylation domain-containing protein
MYRRSSRGFTLNEVLVTCAIIGILSSAIIFSVMDARAKGRDKVRTNDIEQLYLAMRLYVEEYGSEIDCNAGLVLDAQTDFDQAEQSFAGTPNCADGDQIVSFLNSAMGAIPHDPRGPGDRDYYYYFDGSHTCSPNKAILFAVNMETESTNAPDVCPQLVDGSNNEGGYYSTDVNTVGGSIEGTQPYVKELDFIIPPP